MGFMSDVVTSFKTHVQPILNENPKLNYREMESKPFT